MSKLNLSIVLIATVAMLFGAQVVKAETMDSDDFTWKYEMDATPYSQDLTGTPSGVDWELLRGGFTLNGDGTATLSYGADSHFGTFRTVSPGDVSYDAETHSGNVWNSITDATGFTVEIKTKIVGGMYIYVDSGDISNKAGLVVLGEAETRWGSSNVLSTDNNADGFHVFRIAQEANSATFSLWRDNELLATGLVENLTTNMVRVHIGEGGAGYQGPDVIDYVRITTGAYAPVPEPATLVVLASGLIGLLAYAWRKRK